MSDRDEQLAELREELRLTLENLEEATRFEEEYASQAASYEQEAEDIRDQIRALEEQP